MAYLYRHIRLDKNEPFYIGIGIDKHFTRAKTKLKRNNMWYKVVSKTNYEIEIILEHEDYDFIKKKEIEFIALYGRKDIKTGSLVNLTNGGEGTVNVSPEIRQKHSLRMKGKNNPMFGKKRPEHSSILKGRKQEIGWCKGNKNPMFGRNHTEETKKIISEKAKINTSGEKNPMFGKKRPELALLIKKIKGRTVINTKTGELFICISDAAKSISIPSSTLKNKLYKRVKNNTSLIFTDEYIQENI